MVDDARRDAHEVGQAFDLRNFADRDIDDGIAAVGNEGLAVLQPKRELALEIADAERTLELPGGGIDTKRNDFNGDGKLAE